jgi:hypothetical protein
MISAMDRVGHTDGLEDGANAVDDGHEAAANGLEDALNLWWC